MTIQKLKNVCLFFLQLEERANADCRPKLAAHAYKQYCRYKSLLDARKEAENAGRVA